MNLKPALYIVSTPIGNLNDITLRALEVLKNSDIIYCEDTRVSNKLLVKHDIKASLRLYNDNSDIRERSKIKKLVASGKVVSLISDAGTPLISDPGYKLIRDLKENNMPVDVVPGPCAAIAALTLSGLPTNKFTFLGFFPKTLEAKKNLLLENINQNASLVFYETSNRLLSTLQCALDVLGDREANVARELTKMFQESRLNTISNLIEYYTQKPPKGEIVLIISGKQINNISANDIEVEAQELLKSGITAKSATEDLLTKYKPNFTKKEIYKIVNNCK